MNRPRKCRPRPGPETQRARTLPARAASRSELPAAGPAPAARSRTGEIATRLGLGRRRHWGVRRGRRERLGTLLELPGKRARPVTDADLEGVRQPRPPPLLLGESDEHARGKELSQALRRGAVAAKRRPAAAAAGEMRPQTPRVLVARLA